ncbi:hypothetical protein ACIQ9P_26855 [Kitasatospora sp. NPDC094019]|uniref:hypothetical protein n=1 Tax=Kitasatospora sp. NPDC094019 TaxID=3364091 RepID=UPI00381F4CC1
MIRLRTASAAALALSLAGLLGPAPALAADSADQNASRAVTQVNRFFQQYRQDILDGDTQGAYNTRHRYLTEELNGKLDQWATDHHADPVFRAQNVPDGWTAVQGDSGAGHTHVDLTERWGDGSTTVVQYELRLANLIIDDLRNAPA